MMESLKVNRTPELIAAEINSIKNQTRTMVLINSMEIGRRLVEVKELVPRGEWGKWLETSVDYSQSTAENLMRIYQEYSSDQGVLFGAAPKSQAIGNLSYTQAILLLGVPREEREQFIETNDLGSMSTRELQKAIKERDDARNAAQKAEEERDKLREETSNLRSTVSAKDQVIQDTKKTVDTLQDELVKERNHSKSEVDRLTILLEEAKANGDSDDKLEQLQNELARANRKVEELSEELKKPVTVETAVIEKIPEETERELNSLREKVKELEVKAGKQSSVAIQKYTVHFDSLVRGFKDLLGALGEIKETDSEVYEKYRNAVSGLIGKMAEHL